MAGRTADLSWALASTPAHRNPPTSPSRSAQGPPIRRAITVVRQLGTALVLWFVTGHVTEATAGHGGCGGSRAAWSTYIKLGQIISSGEGIFPNELVAEFVKCRDQVPPEPFSTVRRSNTNGSTLERPCHLRPPSIAASIPSARSHTARRHASSRQSPAPQLTNSCTRTSRSWPGCHRSSSAVSRWRSPPALVKCSPHVSEA